MRQYNNTPLLSSILFILMFLYPCKLYGASGTEKDITVSLGDTFIVNPWGDLAGVSQYTCVSTGCTTEDPSAFSINTNSTTNTTWWLHGGENNTHTGYRNTYKIKALKTGLYIINGTSSMVQNGVSYNSFTLNVVYHVKVVDVTSISLPSTLELTIGKSHTLSPVIVEEGANTTLSWTSSKPGVVSVTSAGVIKALTVGKSVITCTASNGVSATCTVTVNPIAVTEVSVNPTELHLNTGEKRDLAASVTPTDATFKDVTWSSSNPNVALVGLDGTVVGVSEGYCNIIATANDGSGKKSSCMVHVISQDISGDVNKDGNVSITDVTDLINHLLNGDNNNDNQFTVNGVSFKMIPVEGGTFTMGATAEQGDEPIDSERPAHLVTLSSYNIGETEVTQELWLAVMGTNPSKYTGDLQRPVEMVSWEDCQIFIATLNSLTGKQFRLPTEAEWEYAARGGNRSLSFKYAGSNNLDIVGWYTANSNSTTHAVKMKDSNELGLYDMSGNVWEWCQDWYGDYSSETQTNPTGPVTGQERLRRGGAKGQEATSCRVSFRNFSQPTSRSNGTGLRLAL